MENGKYDYGMIGLGTMGRNLVYNMCDHGYSVAGFDTDKAKVDALGSEANGANVFGAGTLDAFLEALKTPKVVMLLVPAGKPVDIVINELLPMLRKDDLIIDCGNSHFSDTDVRIARLQKDNIQFMGVGVSGGEWGARHGPSIMPGGTIEAYKRVGPMLEAISAKVNGEPCAAWMGPGSAGHYVKMVHNGIEYGIMQLIAETYHILKVHAGMSNDDLHKVFAKWNEGRLSSFLIGITADIFTQKDDLTGQLLVDMILDKAKQKGTGQWASQSAMDMSVPIPTIDSAVAARDLSALKDERVAAAGKFPWHKAAFNDVQGELVHWLEHTLYFSMVTAYAQGMSLLQYASKEYKYGLKPEDIARIWRGGCIIRAAMLEDIRTVFTRQPDLPNLMSGEVMVSNMVAFQDDMRLVVKTAVDAGIPVPAMMASLAYYDSYRAAWLPANLLQAQRDYFGAHTYERTDKEGSFHTKWNQTQH